MVHRPELQQCLGKGEEPAKRARRGTSASRGRRVAENHPSPADIGREHDGHVVRRNKHFLRVFHNIRDDIMYGRITMLFVRTEEQRADMFTKALSKVSFEKCRDWHVHTRTVANAAEKKSMQKHE